jgi:periplasmic divalent cation tolerance protein
MINMKLYYLNLNTWDEARQIVRSLLEKQLAVCINWFPLRCVHGWQQQITKQPELVLIIKTQDNYKDAIEQTIRQHISYTNSLAELSATNIDSDFLTWFSQEISPQFLSTTHV